MPFEISKSKSILAKHLSARSIIKSPLPSVTQEVKPQEEKQPVIKYLSSTNCIDLPFVPIDYTKSSVAPDSPNENFSFEDDYRPIAEEIRSFKEFEIPYVKEKGVRECLVLLAEYLKFDNYQINMLEFWVLDMLVDCLWKLQDEYGFTDDQQRVIMDWAVCIFNFVRGKSKYFFINFILL